MTSHFLSQLNENTVMKLKKEDVFEKFRPTLLVIVYKRGEGTRGFS